MGPGWGAFKSYYSNVKQTVLVQMQVLIRNVAYGFSVAHGLKWRIDITAFALILRSSQYMEELESHLHKFLIFVALLTSA